MSKDSNNRVTQGDVARKAGVSLPVVSYVVNDGPRPVAAQTRQRVLDAIDDLGYRTNYVARSLRSQRTYTIGLIVPDTTNYFYSAVAKGVEDTTYHNGYSLILCNTDESIKRQSQYIENLVSRQVEGVIYITTTIEAKELVLLNHFNIPSVYIDPEGRIDQQTMQQINFISVDSQGGGCAVATHLLERGHRRMACITGRPKEAPHSDWEWHRQDGFKRVAQEAGCNPDIIWAGQGPDDGYQAALQLLSKEEPPTAIFACNDTLAIGVLRAAHDMGLKVPEDLAVCGFDDIALAQYVTPRLTTVRIRKHALGQKAAELLFNLLNENHHPEIETQAYAQSGIFETELIIREST
jgi:LacI family transcriptional regulator